MFLETLFVYSQLITTVQVHRLVVMKLLNLARKRLKANEEVCLRQVFCTAPNGEVTHLDCRSKTIPTHDNIPHQGTLTVDFSARGKGQLYGAALTVRQPNARVIKPIGSVISSRQLTISKAALSDSRLEGGGYAIRRFAAMLGMEVTHLDESLAWWLQESAVELVRNQ